jgi:electron-transferring-flavoprotein dehydrogenase
MLQNLIKFSVNNLLLSRIAATSLNSNISTRNHTTTHYTVVPRENDDRWKDIDMERATDSTDVMIVGGGPAGLSAAIRLKQLSNKEGKEVRVCLVEKGPYIGAHSLSGAVIETSALDELLPNWKEMDGPFKNPVKQDKFGILTKNSRIPLPMFKGLPMYNHGNQIIRMGHFTKWLSEQAEAEGVEVYAGYAASEILYNEDGSVKG